MKRFSFVWPYAQLSKLDFISFAFHLYSHLSKSVVKKSIKECSNTMHFESAKIIVPRRKLASKVFQSYSILHKENILCHFKKFSSFGLGVKTNISIILTWLKSALWNRQSDSSSFVIKYFHLPPEPTHQLSFVTTPLASSCFGHFI